jgi:hypothetical protein
LKTKVIDTTGFGENTDVGHGTRRKRRVDGRPITDLCPPYKKGTIIRTMSLFEVGKAILEAEGPAALRAFVRQTAYDSHCWQWSTQRADYGSGTEHVCFCIACGCEYHGEPVEFPELNYPFCE